MPSGRLGKAALAANVNTTVYTVPAGKVPTVIISAHNPGATEAQIAIAITDTPNAAAPTDADWFDGGKLPALGTLERGGVVCSPGECIVVRSTVAKVAVRVHGFEEAA